MQPKHLINLIILAILLSWLAPAQAHKVKLFATVMSDNIEGYVYFPGGGRANTVTVKIMIFDNQLQGTVTTNANGEFQFHAKYRATHYLTADLGDGHLAQYTIDSSEFSDALPPLTTEKTTPPIASPSLPTVPSENVSCSNQQLSVLMEKIVSKQLKPLREQLEAYQEKILLHDVLGGIGYIFGVMGLIFYFRKRRG
jgi:nickel transport protein